MSLEPNLVKRTQEKSFLARKDCFVGQGIVVSIDPLRHVATIDTGHTLPNGSRAYLYEVPYQGQTPPAVGWTATLAYANNSPESVYIVMTQRNGITSQDSMKVAGAVAGDLAGFLPDPKVVGIEGIPIDPTPPANDQVLGYVAASNLLRWMTLAGSGGVTLVATLPTPSAAIRGQLYLLEGSSQNSYDGTVLGDNPSHFYPLKESSGHAIDAADPAQDATLGLGVTQGATALLGDGESAYAFDGISSAYLTIEDKTLLTPVAWPLGSNFSLEAVFQCNDFTWPRMVVYSGAGTSTGWGMQADISTGELVLFQEAHSAITSGFNLTAGVAYYAVITYDAAQVRFYVNGVLVASVAATGLDTGAAGHAQIGLRVGQSQPFDGSIEKVALYPYALSDAQVATHYAARDSSTSGSTADSLWICEETADATFIMSLIYDSLNPPSGGGMGGVVGGDLSGTLPNPTVVGLRGHPISGATPTDGEVLRFSTALSAWVPALTSSTVYAPLSNGDPSAPELIFDGAGEVILVAVTL